MKYCVILKAQNCYKLNLIFFDMTEPRKIKILCVEDEQEIRENIADILRDEGFEVFEASNGKYGFESFMQNNPDLVISDIMMPEVDGYALLKLIRENKNIRNNTVPFIFLSALGQKENVIKGVDLSANDYLVKPIDFEMMIAKIKEKTTNSLKVQEVHNRNIKNIKNQVSMMLPNELVSYIDNINQISSILKQEPYGPFPHRRYLEDIEKIYINSTKLRVAVANALDETVIDNRLNVNEEIFTIMNLLTEFVSGLGDKLRNLIEIEPPFDEPSTPKVKIDRLVFNDAMRKILSGAFKSNHDGGVSISIMIDHMDQMVLIFYLKSISPTLDIRPNVEKEEISNILDKQNCRFEIIDGKPGTMVVTIPSYRLIEVQPS